MKLIQNVPWLSSAGLLLLGVLSSSESTLKDSRAGADMSFHSVAGRKLEKKFVQHDVGALVHLKSSAEIPDDPEEIDQDIQGPKNVDDETIEFCDETITAGDGRPRKLKRTFATIENSIASESGEEGVEGGTLKNESGLLGKSVLFTWDADEKSFSAAWFEGDGDDDLLKPMVEDADFRAWLPGKKVDEGDSWTIPVSEFNNLQEPSGPMGYKREGATENPDNTMSDNLRANLKGEIKATFKGTREDDGVKIGVIAFEGTLSSSSEQEIEQDEGPSVKLTYESGNELEGELLWDIAGGHFRSLSCDAASKSSSTIQGTFEIQDSSFPFTQTKSFEGKKTYRFTCAEKKD